MAMCDTRYTITLFDIGQYGSNNDSGILSKSRMGNLFEANKLQVPSPATLRD